MPWVRAYYNPAEAGGMTSPLDGTQLFESAREVMTTIRERVAVVSSAIEAINALPFISIPVSEMERMERLSQHIDSVRTQVQDLRTALDQRRSEIIQGAVSIVTTLGEMQGTVSGYSDQIDAVQEGLSDFKPAIGGWLTWVTVIFTLMLLSIAVS